MEHDPNDAELFLMIRQIKDTIDSNQIENSNAHKNMIARMDIANGRVSKLELWQSYITGSLAIICLVGVPVLLRWLFLVVENCCNLK
jgi:hypothetical protein